MLFVVRFFPEITIKTRPVRHRLIKILKRNLKILLGRLDAGISVTGDWDLLEVESERDDKNLARQVLEILLNTPGISLVSCVEKLPLPDFEGIVAAVLPHYRQQLRGRTFAVRCKRQGTHAFISGDVERHVGASLLAATDSAGVNLDKPDVTVRMEIRQQTLYLVSAQHRGLGGYPLGSQEPVLSLISGGFDSAVASYSCMRRGLQTHYVFFNLGGRDHEIAVKEIALYLWMKYGASHRVKFVSVPFEGVVQEILSKVNSGLMGVVLKRMMLRAADQVARDMRVAALVTGESVAQVASQTLPNLAMIDRVTDLLVLRPLIVTDKQEIIDVARRLGVAEMAAAIPEYCGVISVKPTTNARLERIEEQELNIDFRVLEEAFEQREIQMIDRVVDVLDHRDVEPEEFTEVPPGAVVLDIRHPDEREGKPLILEGCEIQSLPFYQLTTRFAGLDAARHYLLYCDKGLMSRLHASHLKDSGHLNVGVYRPIQ
jgi:tRNA uracil 4-sulfurtransferase